MREKSSMLKSDTINTIDGKEVDNRDGGVEYTIIQSNPSEETGDVDGSGARDDGGKQSR